MNEPFLKDVRTQMREEGLEMWEGDREDFREWLAMQEPEHRFADGCPISEWRQTTGAPNSALLAAFGGPRWACVFADQIDRKADSRGGFVDESKWSVLGPKDAIEVLDGLDVA
jgi:hypothetical protein